jgi:hypothetical protein
MDMENKEIESKPIEIDVVSDTGPIASRKRLANNGLTHIQDCFCRLCAQYPEDLITNSFAAKLYQSIPGVKNNQAATTVYLLMKNPRIIEKMGRYRLVLGKDKLTLLSEREEIHGELVEKWKKNKKTSVKTSDVLQSLKDRESAYNINGRSMEEVNILLNNDRIKEGFKEIELINDPKDIK